MNENDMGISQVRSCEKVFVSCSERLHATNRNHLQRTPDGIQQGHANRRRKSGAITEHRQRNQEASCCYLYYPSDPNTQSLHKPRIASSSFSWPLRSGLLGSIISLRGRRITIRYRFNVVFSDFEVLFR
ncbi:hypothetical protein I7I51_08436 [Histoplasma capsulatum]|uniref:Uncharacterized protein n=1 Tax=Ajellomyces capsulatus TaxID=5037 RepID=A0A8A1M2V2_AJECA|nr:hypothetical protein I7I51_08436 [Histoplasma capsulatum]